MVCRRGCEFRLDCAGRPNPWESWPLHRREETFAQRGLLLLQQLLLLLGGGGQRHAVVLDDRLAARILQCCVLPEARCCCCGTLVCSLVVRLRHDNGGLEL